MKQVLVMRFVEKDKSMSLESIGEKRIVKKVSASQSRDCDVTLYENEYGTKQDVHSEEPPSNSYFH